MLRGTFIAIDFETSGYEPNYACAVGLVRISNGSFVDAYETLICPPSSDVMFTHIHGLTWPMLKTAPTFAQVWPDIAKFCKGADGFVAHNASFDCNVLNACCKAFGCPDLNLPFYCTLKGARIALSHLPSKSLDNVCSYLRIPLNHHEALSDAKACGVLFNYLRSHVLLNRMLLR